MMTHWNQKHSHLDSLYNVCIALFMLGMPFSAPLADDTRIADLEARIQQLEETNQKLLDHLESMGIALDAEPSQEHPSPPPLGLASAYSYSVLDQNWDTNHKLLIQLKANQSGELAQTLTVGGAAIALANYQRASSDSKFGWLMRHPTSTNQIGDSVSELVVHSFQFQTTARLSGSLIAYAEALYNPQQSFGRGTITDLGRNQLQLRRAYLLWGNLDHTPWYAAIGKMDVPFGLNDSFSPFTSSSNWHAFAALAYGGMVGYFREGWHARLMAVQGGTQFRAANAPVRETNVPSRVNNFAVDVNKTWPLTAHTEWLVGASYLHGSAYCQDYPVFHFEACQERNPALAAYARLQTGAFGLHAEAARTTEVWPGSKVPFTGHPLSRFSAQKTLAFTLGGRYALDLGKASDLLLSLEFSRFRAGDDGSPWERQDQYVAGVSYFLRPTVSLFGEAIHAVGWVPLNFVSGGNLPGGETWSEADATTTVVNLGVKAAF